MNKIGASRHHNKVTKEKKSQAKSFFYFSSNAFNSIYDTMEDLSPTVYKRKKSKTCKPKERKKCKITLNYQ